MYALGLLGQTMVGALARSYFSAGRASWYPLAAMTAGILTTAVVGACAVGPWGVTGIAAANAAGITVTAALLLAGVLGSAVDPSGGMTDADRARFTARGLGITNLAPRATAKASELTTAELREGGERLRELVRTRRPRVVAVAGVTAYRLAFGVRTAQVGRQPDPFEGSELWVVPNPSGLNAHETVDSLARAYREVWERL